MTSHFLVRALVACLVLGCAVPAFGQIIDGFESYPVGDLPPQGGWMDFGGSQPITVSTAQAHSGTKSMRLSEGTDVVGGVGGYGSDVFKNFLPAGIYTSGIVIFSYWQFIESAVDSVSFQYISTGRLPNVFQTGLDLRGDAPDFNGFGSSMLVVQDDPVTGDPTLIADPVPLVTGRWVEHSMTINLTTNTFSYSYDGAVLVPAGQWDTTPDDGVSLGGINFWMQAENANGVNHAVFYDDFNTVPEPACASLVLLAGVLLGARRRS